MAATCRIAKPGNCGCPSSLPQGLWGKCDAAHDCIAGYPSATRAWMSVSTVATMLPSPSTSSEQLRASFGKTVIAGDEEVGVGAHGRVRAEPATTIFRPFAKAIPIQGK